MKTQFDNLIRRTAAIAALAAAFFHGPLFAQTTDISNTPLSASASASVLPNLMFVLDDSGSMARDYLPDFVTDSGNCKARSGGSTSCEPGTPPYYSAQFNTIFYNPQITYAPAVNADGTSKGSYGSPWSNVKNDAFNSGSSSTNLVTSFPSVQYCNSSGTDCKRNGIDTVANFEYRSASPDNGNLYGYPDQASQLLWTVSSISKSSGTRDITVTKNTHGLLVGDLISTNGTCTGGSNSSRLETDNTPEPVSAVTANTFTYRGNSNNSASGGTCTYTKDISYSVRNAITTNPHYYTISPKEYCDSADLTNCTASTTPTGAYTFPAIVRYCRNSTDANASGAVSGGSPVKCKAKYDDESATTYTQPRFGKFTRTDIVSSTATYGNRPERTDCASRPTCTYAEEMTNFANWWAYYKTRMQMMKSAAGRAFLPIDSRYRVGFITINPMVSGSVSSNEYLKIADFDAAHKQAWYDKFYSQSSGSGTPLREALSRVGRHFAGNTTGINAGMNEDPVQYSCQQNFTILTTDGYWNGSSGDDVSDNAIGDVDNVNSGYSTRAAGAFDGNIGASGTLADVAMYYYKTDLRGTAGTKTTGALGTDVTKDNVPTSPKDAAPHQHMTTFTLGIVDGLMTYQRDYETATSGDFAKIKQAGTGCSWTSGTCNWPAPANDKLSALDDLWHAAVNGRGTYYQASDPNSVASGLSGALAGLNIRTAAAAASATSSPNITPTDRSIFSSTYTTVEWAGEVVAQDIDPSTGNVVPTIKWSAQAQLDAKVSPTGDTRTIYMFDATAANKLKPFIFGGMTASEQAYFANKCVPASNLSQCALLSAAVLSVANSGTKLVSFLRGQTGNEGTAFRDRTHVLGDTVNATPAYLREPRYAFADAVTPDYASFKAASASRQATLFIAANDGMLHALNANTGNEMWAYVPKVVLPNLYKLAETNYASKHLYFVDGSPQTMDAYFGGGWKTILVGGFNSGGRGYYALDVTDPLNPKALWQVCHDSALCSVSDSDMGLTYGNPVIAKRPTDGKWVVFVTSGYNNVSPGTGRGYLYVLDAETGAILEKLDTGAGDTTTPAGLGKISVWADNGNIDNTGKYVYAGDLRGNLWRFDLTVSPTGVMKIAELKDASGRPQSITTKPELGLVKGNRAVFVGTGRYLGVSDLQDPATWSPASTDAYQQSLYAIKDKGVAYGDIRTGGTLVQQTLSILSPILRSISTNSVNWATDDGWYVDFNPANDSPGERVSIDPQLLLGTLLVTTNVPNTDACSIGGDSWQYQFNYETGQYLATSQNMAAGEKLTNAITVGIVVVRLPGGQLKAIATDAGGSKTTFGVNTGGASSGGKRTGWRELVR